MNLEDLDLDGTSQVNSRTKKFAPKSSKFASKPKKEPSPKQDYVPKQELPSAADTVSKKNENEEVDVKPLVVDESQPNGAVKMEIEQEAREDDVMNEPNREEEDVVVREIDVFFSPSIDDNTQLYVLQYPLRPSWRSYELEERCKEVRVKPKTREVEIDLTVNVDSDNYDSECASRLKMPKQTLTCSWMPPPRTTSYAVGVLMDDKLYLNPIHEVVQLRPSMEHLKSNVSKRKNMGETDEITVKVEESNDGKSVGSSTKQKKGISSSTEQKEDDKEFWVPLKYHDSKSDLSAQYLQRMMAEESCQIHFTMNPHDYLDSLCPGATNDKNNKNQGSYKRLLLALPLEERLKKLLCEGPPFHRFSTLKHFMLTATDEEIFEVLQKYAQLVQGLWVPKSSLLFPNDPSKSLARDYILLSFSKNPTISLAQVNCVSPRYKEDVKELLKSLANERPSFKDWKLKEADEVFKKLYPGIVEKQEQIWRAGEDNVMKHINRGAKGGPCRTKLGIDIKSEAAMVSDKGARKVAPGAHAGRTMSDETREAIPKALKKVFQTHKVCSLQLIRKGLRDLALSQSTLPKADSRMMVVKAAYGADAPEEELKEVVSQVAVELHGGVFVLKSSPDHPEYDELRQVVINLLRVKEKVKKVDVTSAALISLKRDVQNPEYNKVMSELCEYKSNSWVLKSGDGKPS